MLKKRNERKKTKKKREKKPRKIIQLKKYNYKYN